MTDIKMGVREFGDALIQSKDLDPTYVGLHGMFISHKMDTAQLYRWLLAYWCFYHVGAASFLSEKTGTLYWDFMLEAAINENSPAAWGCPDGRWPRAAERRHFRGQKCVDAVKWLRGYYAKCPQHPEEVVTRLIQYSLPTHMTDQNVLEHVLTARTEKTVMKLVQEWPMFGPWIAFKAADMLERCAGVPVHFDADAILMYEEPRKALKLLADGGDPVLGFIQSKTETEWYSNLLTYFSSRRAPPAMDRFCGPQEVETVLCKFKSYMGGHYHVGKDIHDHRGALVGWGPTAELMLKHMPEEV